jgi:hypothetical protein
VTGATLSAYRKGEFCGLTFTVEVANVGSSTRSKRLAPSDPRRRGLLGGTRAGAKTVVATGRRPRWAGPTWCSRRRPGAARAATPPPVPQLGATFSRRLVGTAIDGSVPGLGISLGGGGRRPGRSHVERDRRDTVTNRRCDVNRCTLTANLHASQGGIQRLFVALGEGRGSGASAHCKFSVILLFRRPITFLADTLLTTCPFAHLKRTFRLANVPTDTRNVRGHLQ